jgi:teichuronic acid biosynthesis glycosyltransferase TuaH
MTRLIVFSHTSLKSSFQIGAHHLFALWRGSHRLGVGWVNPPITFWAARAVDEAGTLTPRNLIPIRGHGLGVAVIELINGAFHAIELVHRLRFRDQILVVDNPTYIPALFLAGIPSEQICMRLTDWLPRQVVAKRVVATDLWLRLAAWMTDLWVVTSRPLGRLVSLRYGKSTLVLENGVGPDIVERMRSVTLSAAPSRKRKVVYYGAFDERFDLQLVNELAGLVEDMSFDLYGPEAPGGGLHPRVRYCGYLPYAKISDTLAGYEFGILPFSREVMNQCRFPMKLWEMLACGLQVVAPPIGSLRQLSLSGEAAVWIARSWSPESLAECFTAAARSPRQTSVSQVESQSWAHKAEKLLRILERTPSPVI